MVHTITYITKTQQVFSTPTKQSSTTLSTPGHPSCAFIEVDRPENSSTREFCIRFSEEENAGDLFLLQQYFAANQSRNAIALIGGKRRYILSHPKPCSNLALYPKGHPSARHSAVDWSHPDLEEYHEFAEAMSNEILLQAGDVLYLPTNYFHYIVSLG